MDNKREVVALFDLDGVILDTETLYSVFWNEQGKKYLGQNDFGRLIKGMTLSQIFDRHFAVVPDAQQQIREGLDKLETEMPYDYIPGVRAFILDLKENGAETAVVTSSNARKMEHVYARHPEFKSLFDEILTADMFKKSKPDPDCFLLGMKRFHSNPGNTYVFEDSFHGLHAARASGATVIGVATTNSRDSIRGESDVVIDDFMEMTYDRLIKINQ